MPKTIHGTATIRSLQVICAVPMLPVAFRYQCTRRACLAGEGAVVMTWSPRGIIRAGGAAEKRANGAVAATVLVVEDEPKLRDPVRSYLERAGFTVLSTGSGAEAITMASGALPDLVVLDLGLPDVPGETVARELRAVAATPILMLTAKTTEEDRIRGLELGTDDYVAKPFSPRELVLRVQAILRRGGPAADKGSPATAGVSW
jgi:CheY-like chemotaxis protein